MRFSLGTHLTNFTREIPGNSCVSVVFPASFILYQLSHDNLTTTFPHIGAAMSAGYPRSPLGTRSSVMAN